MAIDRAYEGTASQATDIRQYISGWTVAETAGAAAIVKIRDGFDPLGVASLADGGAGNDTAGVHYVVTTLVTRYGESVIGAYSAAAGFNSAGTKILVVTVPVYVGATKTQIVGRNLYFTKAGAPATLIIPTNAQLFLDVANPSTTTTSANNNLPLVAAGGSVGIVLASAAGFNAGPAWALVTTNQGVFPVLYQSIVGATLTTCTFPTETPVPSTALMVTGNAVTQATIPDNTTTTYNMNTADGGFTATNPPLKSTAGALVLPSIRIPATTGGATAGDSLASGVLGLQNYGSVYVEVTSGTVEWSVRGK